MNPTPADDHLTAWLALTGQTPWPQTPLYLPLLTGSMRPQMPVGCRLHLAACPTTGRGPAPRGAVVVFRENDRLIAHRLLLVLRLGPWRLLLEKGDANCRGRWRTGGSVCGRVVGFTLPDGSDGGDPTDPRLAARSLRHHFRNYLPARPAPTAEEEPDD